MRNKFVLLLHLCITVFCVDAQVGINTVDPYATSILHIRSDESSNNGYENDLIIDANTGYLGLGTATPTVRLDVNGSFRFTDKGQTDFSDNILVSDSEGNASWKSYYDAFNYKKVIWNLSNEDYPNITASNNIINLEETTDFISTIPGSFNTGGYLTLPKGRYYITVLAGLSNDVDRYIYQILKIIQEGKILIESYYFNTSSSSSLFLDLKESATLNIQIEVPDIRSDPASSLPIAAALPLVGPNKVWAKINVLTLDVVE